jgi:hypothetical protein
MVGYGKYSRWFDPVVQQSSSHVGWSARSWRLGRG